MGIDNSIVPVCIAERMCASQPAGNFKNSKPLTPTNTGAAGGKDGDASGQEPEKVFNFSGFTQPAQLSDLCLSGSQSTQGTQGGSSQTQFQRLVKRMTRFWVKTAMTESEKFLCSILSKMGYSSEAKAGRGDYLIETIDRRGSVLSFRMTLIQVDRILVDFRLSRGDGLEFKKHFGKIKTNCKQVVEPGPIMWPTRISTSAIPSGMVEEGNQPEAETSNPSGGSSSSGDAAANVLSSDGSATESCAPEEGSESSRMSKGFWTSTSESETENVGKTIRKATSTTRKTNSTDSEPEQKFSESGKATSDSDWEPEKSEKEEKQSSEIGKSLSTDSEPEKHSSESGKTTSTDTDSEKEDNELFEELHELEKESLENVKTSSDSDSEKESSETGRITSTSVLKEETSNFSAAGIGRFHLDLPGPFHTIIETVHDFNRL